MKTKIQIMKELSEAFEDFKNKETKMHDLYELSYYCYMEGRKDKISEDKLKQKN